MNKNKSVSFSADTKDHNSGSLRIHNKNKIKNAEDIKHLMFYTNVSYDIAVKVYTQCKKDIVDSMMYIAEQKMGY